MAWCSQWRMRGPRPEVPARAVLRRCSGCQECIDTFGYLASNIPDAATAAEITEAVLATCNEAAYDASKCQQAAAAVAASMQGNIGRRPAAVCRRLGACAPGAPCNVTVVSSVTRQVVTAMVDECTIDGVVNGAPAGGNMTSGLAAGQCWKDSDCGKAQLCERYGNSPVLCSCKGGVDSCTPVGTCADFCSSNEAHRAVASINAKVGGACWCRHVCSGVL
jgi:hypothetical protein